MGGLSVGIVGAGRIAGAFDEPSPQGAVSSHAQAYARHPSFRLHALVEPDRQRRERFQAIWNVPQSYARLDDMLAAEPPDVVSVCSATSEHGRQVLRLLEDGRVRAILCEKPLCQQPCDLESLLAARRQNPDTVVLVNHTRRFDPAHRSLAGLIRERRFGAFVGGRCDYYGGWLHNGSHLIDTLRMLLGEVVVARATPGVAGKPDDPCLDVGLLDAGGAPLDLYGFDERLYQIFEIDLRFESGRVLLRNFGEDFVIERVSVNSIGERFLIADSDHQWRGLQSPLLHAVDAISGYLCEHKPTVDFGASLEDAAETMKVLWKAAELAA